MITENGYTKFIKLYPHQFQNSQEFTLDGGVIFDILANSIESHAEGLECSFQHFSVQYGFDF